jgi:hypothetical protein
VRKGGQGVKTGKEWIALHKTSIKKLNKSKEIHTHKGINKEGKEKEAYSNT